MIPMALLRLLKPVLPYLLAAAAVVSLIIYIGLLRHDLAAENTKNTELALDNQADLAAISAYKAQAAKWSVALAALDARTMNRNMSTTRIIDRIGSAVATDDAPVAPVLAQALDGLRTLQSAAP